jgi:Tol biopolymer transport system component
VLRSPAYVHARVRSLSVLALCVVVTLGVLSAAIAPVARAVTVGPLPAAGAPGLPDSRGYEQVSPVQKGSNNVAYSKGYNAISESGTRVTFAAGGAFAGVKGSPANVSYLASRAAADEWLTQGLTPAQSPYAIDFAKVWDSDRSLSKTLVDSSAALVPGASNEYGGLYLANNLSGEYELVAPGRAHEFEPGFFGSNISAMAGTSDFSHVAFESNARLLPSQTEYLNRVYDFSAGALHTVSILPDGSIPAGASALAGAGTSYGGGYPIEQHAISTDGSRIFFTAASEEFGPSLLYVRIDDSTTVLVSRPDPGVVDPNGAQSATFGTASADGSVVYFYSAQKLTADATAQSGNDDLYRYELASGHLTDLTTADPEGAGVNSVLGASEDGSYVYFNANAVLAPGASAEGDNIYALHDGVTRFVAIADPGAAAGNFHAGEDSRVTPDGKHVSFLSTLPTTGYDNAGKGEYYIYDYDSDELRCISCNPSGRPPLHGNSITNFQFGGSFPEREYAPRALSVDGSRYFFTSEEALLPQDTDGQPDVYEWENGTLYLITSGTSAEPSDYGDSTPSGDDVIFETQQSLLSQDDDANYDVYDARVGGGVPPALAAGACTGTGCQGVPPATPIFATPASATFNGVGNFAPAKASKPKAKKKPVRAKSKHKAKAKKRSVKRKGKQTNHKPTSKGSSSRAGR